MPISPFLHAQPLTWRQKAVRRALAPSILNTLMGSARTRKHWFRLAMPGAMRWTGLHSTGLDHRGGRSVVETGNV